MFRRSRNRYVKSTPLILDPLILDPSKKSKEPKLKLKEKKKLKKFNKESKEENVVTKLKSPSPSTSSNISQSHSNEDQYIITAHLQNDVLTITVYHAIKSMKWRQQFTQNSFKGISIHKVSKILIRSIQETANKGNGANKKNKNKSKKKKRKNDFIETREVQIFENRGFCYVTLINSDLPSFALRPIYETSLPQSINCYNYNQNTNHLSPSTATNTTITDIEDKGPGFVDDDYYKHKTIKASNNVKYGFV